MANITFIGLGWLSKAASLYFTKHNFKVKATKRNAEEFNNIEVFSWSLGTSFPSEAVSDYIVISIASRNHQLNDYQQLFTELKSFQPKKVILISTTSVYGNRRGVLEEWIDLTEYLEENIHLQISRLFQEYFPEGIVLRLAGLVGPGRNPAKFLAGKINVADPNLSVNMVHQKDVIRVIEKCIINDAKGIYNVCASKHPTRIEFYTKLALHYHFQAPQFVEDTKDESIRIVSNSKIKSELNFEFEVDDVLNYYLSSTDND